MENREKEVYFDEYCPKCKFYALDEAEEPCDSCLAEPVNTYSHKPLFFKEK